MLTLSPEDKKKVHELIEKLSVGKKLETVPVKPNEVRSGFEEIAKACGDNAHRKGFWSAWRKRLPEIVSTYSQPEEQAVATEVVEFLGDTHGLRDSNPELCLLLMVEELIEAFTVFRNSKGFGPEAEEHVLEEIADVIIRAMDFSERFFNDGAHRLFLAMVAKMAVNEARPALHGKNY